MCSVKFRALATFSNLCWFWGFTSVKYQSPLDLHNYCWWPRMNSILTHILAAVPPGICKKCFFLKTPGEQKGEKTGNEFGNWHLCLSWVFFLVEFKFGLCFWETSFFFLKQNSAFYLTKKITKLSVVSSYLKCKMVWKTLIFSSGICEDWVFCEYFNKMKILFKKKNV